MAGRHVDGGHNVFHRHAAVYRRRGRLARHCRQLGVVGLWRRPCAHDLRLCASVAAKRDRDRCRAHRNPLRRPPGRGTARHQGVPLRRSDQLHRNRLHHARCRQGCRRARAVGEPGLQRRRVDLGDGPEAAFRDWRLGPGAGLCRFFGAVGCGGDGLPAVLPCVVRRDHRRMVRDLEPGSRRTLRPRQPGAAANGFRRPLLRPDHLRCRPAMADRLEYHRGDFLDDVLRLRVRAVVDVPPLGWRRRVHPAHGGLPR